jgi:hypothetical protein
MISLSNQNTILLTALLIQNPNISFTATGVNICIPINTFNQYSFNNSTTTVQLTSVITTTKIPNSNGKLKSINFYLHSLSLMAFDFLSKFQIY